MADLTYDDLTALRRRTLSGELSIEQAAAQHSLADLAEALRMTRAHGSGAGGGLVAGAARLAAARRTERHSGKWRGSLVGDRGRHAHDRDGKLVSAAHGTARWQA